MNLFETGSPSDQQEQAWFMCVYVCVHMRVHLCTEVSGCMCSMYSLIHRDHRYLFKSQHNSWEIIATILGWALVRRVAVCDRDLQVVCCRVYAQQGSLHLFNCLPQLHICLYIYAVHWVWWSTQSRTCFYSHHCTVCVVEGTYVCNHMPEWLGRCALVVCVHVYVPFQATQT